MRKSIAAAVAMAAALSGGACTADEADEVVPAVEDAKTGGAISVSLPAITTVDPADATSWSEVVLADTMCDTLLDLDPVTGEVVAGLARSWVVSDDGYRVVLQLRDDLHFSDGTPLTAREVADSLTRLASPDTASRMADLLAPIDGFAELRGRVDARNAADRVRLRGVRQPTSQSIELVLSEPRADLIHALTHPATAPVSTVAVTADPSGFRRRPVCAGPYALASAWDGGRQLDLDRVPYAGGQAAFTNGGAGYVDAIRVRFDGATNADVARVFALPARTPNGTEVVTAPGAGVDYIGLATATGGADPEAAAAAAAQVRRALSLAIDRDAIGSDVFDGTRIPARTVVPVSIGNVVAPCRWVVAEPAVDEARAQLQRSGADLTDNPIELLTSDDFRNVALAEAVAAQWRDTLGLTVEVRAVPFVDFLDDVTATSRDVEAFRMSWSPRTGGLDAPLHALFHSSQWDQGNLARFSDPTLDDLLTDDARQAEDPADGALFLREALDRVCDQLPLIPVVAEQVLHQVRTSRVGSASGRYAGGYLGAPALRELFVR